MEDVTINGTPLSDFGGASLRDFVVGEVPLSPELFQGRNRTSWRLLQNSYGLREIQIGVVFRGKTLREAKQNRSRLNLALFYPADLYIPEDGFHYRAICVGLGDEETVGIAENEAQIKCKYEFKGVRHDPLVRVSVPAGGSVHCLSTIPFTDVRLTATVASGTSFQLGGAEFGSVQAGDVLVFDGINGIVLRNGINWALNTVFTSFPFLFPGENTITASGGTVTVEYEPSYL